MDKINSCGAFTISGKPGQNNSFRTQHPEKLDKITALEHSQHLENLDKITASGHSEYQGKLDKITPLGHSQHRENVDKCIAVTAVVGEKKSLSLMSITEEKTLFFSFNWKAENE